MMEGALWSNLSTYFPLMAAPWVLFPLIFVWVMSGSWIVGLITLAVAWLGWRMFIKGWRRGKEVAWIRKP